MRLMVSRRTIRNSRRARTIDPPQFERADRLAERVLRLVEAQPDLSEAGLASADEMSDGGSRVNRRQSHQQNLRKVRLHHHRLVGGDASHG